MSKPKLLKSNQEIEVEKRISELEKRVATLEGRVQEQPKIRLINDYELNIGKPKLLKPKRKKLFNKSKKLL